MGAACTNENLSEEQKKSLDRAKDLEKYNKQTNKENAAVIKLLLLGTGDSGKSTFLKQMKVSQLDGFSRNETLTYMVALKNNTLRSMEKLLDIAEEHNTSFSSRTNDHIAAFRNGEGELTKEVADAVAGIWGDSSFKKFYNEVNSFAQVPSCTPYYFENSQRFVGDFKPSNEDIIRAKLKTTGIFETEFEFKDLQFKIVDVGGQRAERRKWMHCFTDVRAIIFLAALNEYNMTLEEDGVTNRMEESIQLFKDITASRFLSESIVVLFLNKSDLFKKKIKEIPLSDYFDAPTGMGYNESYEFVLQKYLEAYSGESRCYPFKTCALDNEKCIQVFTSVTDDVLQTALRKAGI